MEKGQRDEQRARARCDEQSNLHDAGDHACRQRQRVFRHRDELCGIGHEPLGDIDDCRADVGQYAGSDDGRTRPGASWRVGAVRGDGDQPRPECQQLRDRRAGAQPQHGAGGQHWARW